MRKRELICDFQNYILQPPIAPQQMRSNSTSADAVTIESWRDVWIENIRKNKKFFGSFKKYSLGHLWGQYLHRPAIIAGSGPSLKHNFKELNNRGSIPLFSCLHNFHYFEDNGIAPDYYVSLDAGPVVLDEIAEGGNKTPEEYWELTKDRTLIAYIASDPRLFEKWQGKIYLYNAPVPDKLYEDAWREQEQFNLMVSNGGNVLGACIYISKVFMGCATTIFVGADFSFDPGDLKFHSWDSKYDKNIGYCVPVYDVFGHKVKTWQSYKNFKNWFEWLSIAVPGEYINCSEGGCLGSYPEGNLVTIKQQSLSDCFKRYDMHKIVENQCKDPEDVNIRIAF